MVADFKNQASGGGGMTRQTGRDMEAYMRSIGVIS